jgi:tetratricopeptide (TPR) repeat protein
MTAHQWQDALVAVEESTKMYQDLGDQERIVKLYHFKGDALYNLGRLPEAKDIYREGLSAARASSRKDGLLMNFIGLAKVASAEGDETAAKAEYGRAAGIAHELGREKLARELDTYATKPPLRAPHINF